MRQHLRYKTSAEVFKGQRRTMEQPRAAGQLLTCATGAGNAKSRGRALPEFAAVFHRQ